jgi:hypothetical protein
MEDARNAKMVTFQTLDTAIASMKELLMLITSIEKLTKRLQL